MIGLPESVALAILVGTILLIAWHPGGLPVGIPAILGAALMIIAGWAKPADAWETVQNTYGIMLFLVGMMIVATVADEAGFFDWVAGWAIKSSGGRGRLLYVYLYLLGAAITLVLSLDVTAVIFTPIVCAVALKLRLKAAPFVFASAFVANTASLTLPVSNLTNMLVYGLLGIDFWSFVRYMALPNLAAVAINLIVFLVLFRRDIPASFDNRKLAEREVKQRFRTIAGWGLGTVVISLLAAGFAGWPLWTVACAGAAGLAGTALAMRQINVATLRRGVAWQLPLFVVGMYVIVMGVNRAAFSPLWQDLLRACAANPQTGAIFLAFGTGAGANLVNNIPMSLVAISALKEAPVANPLLSFATVIGTNLGPNLTVFGSLATMLVLDSARRRGIQITARQYLRIGMLTTPPMILAASLLLVAHSPH